MSQKCCVRTCRELSAKRILRGHPEPRTFRFPPDLAVKAKWDLFVNQANRTTNFKGTGQSVCERHFEPSCISKNGKLFLRSVPTLADRFTLEVAKKFRVTRDLKTTDLKVINDFTNTAVKLIEDEGAYFKRNQVERNGYIRRGKNQQYEMDSEFNSDVNIMVVPDIPLICDDDPCELNFNEEIIVKSDADLLPGDTSLSANIGLGDGDREVNVNALYPETNVEIKKELVESRDEEEGEFEQVFVKEETIDPNEFPTERHLISENEDGMSRLNEHPESVEGGPSTSTLSTVERVPGYSESSLERRSFAEGGDLDSDPDNPDELSGSDSDGTSITQERVGDILEDRPFECDQCKRRFTKKRHLTYHMQIHTGGERKKPRKREKRFQCSECDKRFIQIGHLREHVRIHTEEKPFSCTECNQQFTKNSNLTSHMRTHTGERPFKCHKCDKNFPHHSSLRKHLKTHNGEPAECPHCNRKFERKSYLQSHMRIHAAPEKLFKCNVCNAGFDRVNPLIEHMRSHTGDKSIPVQWMQ